MKEYIGIKGDISRVQSNLDFYLQITSTEGINSVEDLRKQVYKKFLSEEREKIQNLEIPKELEDEKSIADEILDSISEIDVEEFTDEPREELIKETEEEIEYVSKGIFLDEIEDSIEDEDKGIYEEENIEYEEDIEYEYEDEIEDEEVEYEETYEDIEEDETDKISFEEVEELYPKEIEEGTEDLEVAKEDEGLEAIQVPTDIRDFLRQNPNSEIGFVQKFYSAKEIDKQLKLGRIYKKKGKLMI